MPPTMTSVAPRSRGRDLNKMVSKTPRGDGSGLSQKSSDEGPHYHIHYHCRHCEDHGHGHGDAAPGTGPASLNLTLGDPNDKHIQNLGNLPFLDIIPANFIEKNGGRTRVQWSRHSAPQTGGSFQLKWAKHNVTEMPNRTSSTRRNVKDSPAARARMAKTKTETTVRTYTKDGKRYEETTVVETKEEDDGTVTTTTRTTTKTLQPFTTNTLVDAIDAVGKKGRGGRKSSSSSSNDSSPSRVKVQTKNKPESRSSKASKAGGLFSTKKSSGKSSGDGGDDDDDFTKSVLNSVNDYRAKHGVAKLKLSKELNKYAKEWAKKLASEDKMSHRPEGKYGENVFCLSSNSTNFDVKPNEVVDHWYSEVKDHTFGEEPKGSVLKSGHFSQLVWKDTKQMGLGKARSAAGTKVFVVANFDPQGNWMGQFANQVPPLGGFTKAGTRKSSSSSESSSSDDEEDFAEDCLKAHNDYRRKHGAPPLKLSKKLSKVAKDWCETMARKDVMQHRPNNQNGENLYCYYSPDPKFKIKGDEAVKSWYSEINDFRFGSEPRDLRAGHFTQVVWTDSKELGVACVKSRSGKMYVVANYSPAGNYVGSFASKVPRPK